MNVAEKGGGGRGGEGSRRGRVNLLHHLHEVRGRGLILLVPHLPAGVGTNILSGDQRRRELKSHAEPELQKPAGQTCRDEQGRSDLEGLLEEVDLAVVRHNRTDLLKLLPTPG